MEPLANECFDARIRGARGVYAGVAAGDVSAYLDEAGRLSVSCKEVTDLCRPFHVLGRRDFVGHARDTPQDIDRRKETPIGELARKDDVTVEDSTHGIGDRI